MSPGRKTTSRKQRTAPLTAAALPHLSAFLSGYMHQDFLHDYDSPADALAGFLAECSPAERQALTTNWRTFRAATKEHPWRDARNAFSALGGAWLPPSRAALDALFSALSV